MRAIAFTLTILLVVFTTVEKPSAQSAAQPSMAAWLRGAYTSNRTFIARAADMVPQEMYGMRPGSQQEVRTFGQLVGHLANFNYLWCSQARGEKNPNAGHDFEKDTDKAALVKGINGALKYCDGVYGALTDASGNEVVTVLQENGRRGQSLRLSLLVLNYGHNNEHYGNMVTYMRIKNMVPPSSTAP